MNRRSVIFIIFVTMFILASIYLFVDLPSKEIVSANIEEGHFNLSNFEQVNIQLNGEWEIIEGELVEPYDFEPSDTYMKIPSLWKYDGVVTYRCSFFSEKEYTNIAIKTPLVYSAYNLYFNDLFISHNGYPALTKEEEVIERKYNIIPIHINQGLNTIVLQVSNHTLFRGGVSRPIIIRDQGELIKTTNVHILFDMVFIGGFLFSFIFLMIIYLIRSEQITFLHFAVISFGLFLKTIVSNAVLITYVIDDFPWEIGNRIESGFNLIIFPLMLVLILEIFRDIFSVRIIRILNHVIIANFLIVSFLPHKVYDTYMYFIFLVLIFIAFYGGAIIYKNIKYYYQEVVILTIGLFIIVGFAINDLGIYLFMRPVPYKVHFSIFIFSLYLILVLVVRGNNIYEFNLAKNKEEKLIRDRRICRKD